MINFLKDKDSSDLFICDDFNQCGTYKNIRSSLVRLCENNLLERIVRGVYRIPSHNIPDDFHVAQTICRKNGSTVFLFKKELIGKTKVMTIHTNGSTRVITLPSGCVLKFVHKSEHDEKN